VISCNPPDYSVLNGKELNLPNRIKNKRVELCKNGNRNIFWISEDFRISKQNVNRLIYKLQLSRSYDLKNDTFLLINNKLKNKFEKVSGQIPVPTYYVAESIMNFSEIEQYKKSLLSSHFTTNSDYIIRSIKDI
jgi:hypothetical protein